VLGWGGSCFDIVTGVGGRAGSEEGVGKGEVGDREKEGQRVW